MKKKNAAHAVIAVCTVILLCAIFIMSAEPAPESEETSLIIGRTIGRIMEPDFSGMTAAEQTGDVIHVATTSVTLQARTMWEIEHT